VGAAWQGYSTAPVFTLSSGNGTKTVYLKVKNSAGESSVVSDTIVLTEPQAPVVTSFAINSGAGETTTRNVTLNNTCTGSPTQCTASEYPDFHDVAWQPYSAGPTFTLSSGNGTKTVYFKARNAAGESSVVGDSITLNESGDGIVELVVNGPVVVGEIESTGDYDWYRFEAAMLGEYTIETWAGTLTDNYMYLYGPNSQYTLLEVDDNDGEGNMAKIVRTLSPGTYYVRIRARSYWWTGTYTIGVSRK
jgi:hypothetical protein